MSVLEKTTPLTRENILNTQSIVGVDLQKHFNKLFTLIADIIMYVLKFSFFYFLEQVFLASRAKGVISLQHDIIKNA
jgi:hypothetical protein